MYQGDVRGTIGIVFDKCHLSGNPDLIAFEIDRPE
jgi:hypothetical protein